MESAPDPKGSAVYPGKLTVQRIYVCARGAETEYGLLMS